MPMNPKSGSAGPSPPPQVAAGPVYEDFRPAFERKCEEEVEKLLVYLPDFQKENIKVSIEGKNTLRIRGEHLVVGNICNRFQQDFPAPEDCDMTKIRTWFQSGILTITMPTKKLVQHEVKETQKTPTTPPEETQPPPEESQAPPTTSQNTSEGHEKPDLHKPPVEQDSPPKFTSPMHSESEEKDNYEDKAKQKEKDEGQTTSSAGNYMKAVKSLTEPYEKRQLLMSAGVAVLAIVALGTAYISLQCRDYLG
nr:inactive protein RESTRICTED TEV MOVEMENT 2-like [Ipomoea batatas]